MSGVSVLAAPGGPSPQINYVDSQSTPYSLSGQLPPELALRQQQLNRRQQIANALLLQGTKMPQGQMVGGWYVPPSWAQNAAQLGQGIAGLAGTYFNDQAEKDIGKDSQNQLAEAVANYKSKVAPTSTTNELEGPGAPVQIAEPGQGFTPEELAQPAGGRSSMKEATDALFAQRSPAYFQEGPRPTITTTTPATPEARQQALVDLLASQHPMAAHLGQLLSAREAQQQAHEEDVGVRREGIAANTDLRKSTIESNALNTQALIDSKERMGQDANELKRQLADQQAELKRMEIKGQAEARQQGKTPPGYRATPQGNLEAIPGGPADLKQQGVLNQDTGMLQSSNAAMDRLATSANEILKHPGLDSITGLRGAIPNIPGTNAADAAAKLATLKSQIGFGVLQEMRNNSKSGSSGLGAVSDAEGKRLESNLAALDQAQSGKQMRESLQKIVDYADQAKGRLRDAYNLKHKTGEPAAAAPSAIPGPVAPFTDAEKEARYQEWKKSHQ